MLLLFSMSLLSRLWPFLQDSMCWDIRGSATSFLLYRSISLEDCQRELTACYKHSCTWLLLPLILLCQSCPFGLQEDLRNLYRSSKHWAGSLYEVYISYETRSCWFVVLIIFFCMLICWKCLTLCSMHMLLLVKLPCSLYFLLICYGHPIRWWYISSWFILQMWYTDSMSADRTRGLFRLQPVIIMHQLFVFIF